MIAKTLVFVCAAFGLVAGSCFEFKPCSSSSQVISLPVQSESPCLSQLFSSGSSISVPVVAEPTPVVVSSAPVVSEQAQVVVSAPSEQSQIVIAAPSSGSSLSEIFSSGSSSGSSYGVAPTNGPESSSVSVIQAPSVTLPAVEGPIVTLSSQPIPRPQVLSQRCICTKTILKPQVYQRTVTVPKIQRYLKRTVTPVVENVAYKSTPITQASSSSSGSSSGAILISGSGSSSGSSSSQFVLSSGSSSSSSPVVFSSGSSCPRLC